MIVMASKPRMVLRHFLKCAQKHSVFRETIVHKIRNLRVKSRKRLRVFLR